VGFHDGSLRAHIKRSISVKRIHSTTVIQREATDTVPADLEQRRRVAHVGLGLVGRFGGVQPADQDAATFVTPTDADHEGDELGNLPLGNLHALVEWMRYGDAGGCFGASSRRPRARSRA
jgi:hypothetical protein